MHEKQYIEISVLLLLKSYNQNIVQPNSNISHKNGIFYIWKGIMHLKYTIRYSSGNDNNNCMIY